MAKANTETEALFLRPKSALVGRLREAAKAYGYDSHNQVAVEVLDVYLDFWLEVKEIEARALDEQRSQALGKAQAPTTRRARKVA